MASVCGAWFFLVSGRTRGKVKIGVLWIKRKTSRFVREVLYPGRESNPHVFKGHWILSPARLPIPPPGLVKTVAKVALFCHSPNIPGKILKRFLCGGVEWSIKCCVLC